jgi:UDP-N-acetylmuramate--alanine ligase
MLAELMRLKYGIAIGRHPRQDHDNVDDRRRPRRGRYDPTIIVGGRVTSLGSNVRLGQGDFSLRRPTSRTARS